MRTVDQILVDKGRTIFFVEPGDSVYRALEMMAERGVGALLVMQSDVLAGIISERDYARKGILLDRSSKETSVSEIMTDKVVTVEPHTTLHQCMELMTDKRIRHLPVMEGGKVVGVVSIGDVVRAMITEQERMIEELERYITG